MSLAERFHQEIAYREVCIGLLDIPMYHEAIGRFVARYVNTLQGGGKLVFAGNGGSAADAQHIAAEYVVKFTGMRRALAAMALTVDSSVLTACGNDFGFQYLFSRQCQALVGPKDLLILHSTSGDSGNLIAAARWAQKEQVQCVALLGRDGGMLKDLVNEALVVPSNVTSVIQELHLALQHIICGEVERELGVSQLGVA